MAWRAYLLLLFFQACTYVVLNGDLIVLASEIPADDCAADSSTCDEPDNRDKNVSSPWAFMQAFSKLGTSWNHVIGEYRSVVAGADGVDLKGDVYAKNIDEALKSLQAMVQVKMESASEDDIALSWTFPTTPLADFDKTIDDVLLAFLRWSVVDTNADDKSCNLIGNMNEYAGEEDETSLRKINVTKAFRRLTAYISWMRSVSSHLDTPLTFESISPSLSIFSIHVTHDSCGRLVWWVNLGKTDMSAFKSQSVRETTRLFVWVSHLLFLDVGAQTKGLLVIDDMASISFYEYMTMLPIQVGISVDRFLISVTPLKAKNVVLMHLPKWAEIGYGLLSWFLTAAMKSRVTMVTKGEEIETLQKVVGGSEYIPTEFGTFGGELKPDIIGMQHAA